ncbi:MAG: hypothetical protein HOY71_09240 [Nonomuraea sp.]|nr:hypothetical protein [Nonomuraea sp.]
MSTASPTPVLRLDKMRWVVHGRRHRLEPEPLTLSPGQTALVSAGAAAEAFTDVLLGLARLESGAIRMAGQDISAVAPDERAIGLIPAGGGLLPNRKVDRNIALAAQSRPVREFVPGNVRFAAERTRVDAFLKRYPHELAPDDRARVALARALMRQRLPRVLLVEDRTGHAPCHPVVSAARDTDAELAILVITDDRSRVPTLCPPSLTWETTHA